MALALASALVACESRPRSVQDNLQKAREEQAPDKLLARGRGFASVGDLTRAEEYLVAALDAGADPRATMAALLDVCVRAGKYRVAIQYAEAFLKQHPGDDGTRFVLGTLHAAVGDVAAARQELERVVTSRPRDTRARWTLAVLLRDQAQDPVAADPHFRAYLDAGPNAHAEEARDRSAGSSRRRRAPRTPAWTKRPTAPSGPGASTTTRAFPTRRSREPRARTCSNPRRVMIPREIFEETLLQFFEPIREHLEDPAVSDIMINGPDQIYVEKR